MSVAQANDTINMLEAEVDELQAELAATQAVAAKHQRTAAASGQEIKVLQRLSSSGDISFMRTHSQTGRRSTTGHRHSEQGIPNFGSHDDLIHLQVCVLLFGVFLCSPSSAWMCCTRIYLCLQGRISHPSQVVQPPRV